METVLSYAWRRNRPQHPSQKGKSPQTPRRRHTDRQAGRTAATSEAFATPPECEDAAGKSPQRRKVAMTQLEPTTSQEAATAASMPIPALFSPLTSSSASEKATDPANGAGAAAPAPVTPEGLRPRPTVCEMRTILNLHLATPIPPPSKPPPKLWFNDDSISQKDVASTPDGLQQRQIFVNSNARTSIGSNDQYALVEHIAKVPTNVVALPQCIADTVSISSNHYLSMSALTYSPATDGAGMPQRHQLRNGPLQKVASGTAGTAAAAGFSSPPISFGSPSFFPASVSRGIATTSPTPRRLKGIATSPTLTISGAKTAVGLLVAKSLEVSQSCEVDRFRTTTTPLQTAHQSSPSDREFTGIAMSPNLTLSGAKTAVGLATVESFEKDESRANDAGGSVSNKVVGNDGAASTPNLTMSGAKTAVGLAVAESFDKDENGSSDATARSNNSSSSNSLTRVGAVVFDENKARCGGAESSSDRMALLPPRDWSTDDVSSVGKEDGSWVSFRGFGLSAENGEGSHQHSQPRTIPHAASDASSLYEEEGERLRQQTSRSAASSTVTTPRTKRSRSTEQTPSTAGRTWDHYQQYYAHEDDSGHEQDEESDLDCDNDACEYTALHRPLLELHGSVDVSRDISFSSRQGFLSERDRGHYGSSRGGVAAAYDFGRLEGIASKSGLASLDGSSIRPNPSVEGELVLPPSPPRIPLSAQRQINVLPSSPPSLPNGSQHELDVLPMSPPAVPGNILCNGDIDSKYQRPVEVRKEDVDMSSIVFGLDPNVSALSHATGTMSALVGGEGDTTLGLLPKMEEDGDCESVASGYANDDVLVKRKRRHQIRSAKENQLKEVIEQLRGAPSVVRTICSSKGVLGEAATSIFSGYTDFSRSSILNEFDSLLTFVFDDDQTRESIRFVQRLVESAPERISLPSSNRGPSPSRLETPRNVPLTGNNDRDRTCWKASDDLLRALGMGGYSSPDAADRGGDTSLFTLPTNSTTPNISNQSNQSMATTITSEPNSSNELQEKNAQTTASRRLRLTAEAVVLLLQQITVAAHRLPDERLRDDTLWAASVEEIKRGYRYLLQIPDDDLENLQAAFTPQGFTPHQNQNSDEVLGPPVLSRGLNSTNQLIEASKRLDLRSPEALRMIDGEINNPPHVVRAMATFEANSSPRPVVPTVSEEPEEDVDFDNNGYSGDREGYHALDSDDESDSVVTSEPRDLLTSFEDGMNDSELIPESPMLQEVGDVEDEQSQDEEHEEPFVSMDGLRDQLGEDLRRLCFDTSTMVDHRDDAEDDSTGSERDGPSADHCCSRTIEMSV